MIDINEYHLVVTDIGSNEILYHRDITRDVSIGLQCLDNYLDEVEREAGLSFSPELPFPDTGEVKVTIGFSPSPQNDVLIWDSKEFLIELPKVEQSAFEQWLATNYSPAGADVSNGEKWFLSNSPHEFMPISLSKLREQYNLDNEIESDEEVDENEPENVTTFQIPEHYLSLIFNGDSSGYEEEEIKAWEEFEQRMLVNGFTNGHWSYPENVEAYTTWSNDVTNIGDTVVDLQWVEMS